MQPLDDTTASGWLRRWYLLDGMPRCPFDAVDPARISGASAAAILAANAAVREAVARVEGYEADLGPASLPEPVEPTDPEPAFSDPRPEGEEAPAEPVESAAHAAWRAAREAWEAAYERWVEVCLPAAWRVAAASAETRALAQRRTGLQPAGAPDPVTGEVPAPEPYPADPVPVDTLVLIPLEAMVPDTISDRQFAQVLALDGVISQDEALAWAARGDLPDAMEDALAHVPETDGLRFGARMLLSAATAYERKHPLVPTLGALLTNPVTGGPYDAAALDSIWVRGAALL